MLPITSLFVVDVDFIDSSHRPDDVVQLRNVSFLIWAQALVRNCFFSFLPTYRQRGRYFTTQFFHTSVPHHCVEAAWILVIPLPAQRTIHFRQLLSVLLICTHQPNSTLRSPVTSKSLAPPRRPSHFMQNTLHGSRRATQCVCVARTHTIFMPSTMCVWLSVGCVLVRSFSCFSLSFTSSLPYPTCTLTGTSSPLSTAPREITAAPPHNEEHCTMAIKPSSHRLWAQNPWRLPLLRDFCDDLPEWIRPHGYGALALVWRGTRRWDHRKSAIFTTVHSGARRTSNFHKNN